jgi:hypothetical protein
MNDNYEYRDFGLPPNAPGPDKHTISRLLQPLGDDAWEIISVEAKREFDRGGLTFGPWNESDNPLHRWVKARRPHYGTPGPRSWEYTGFNINGMPSPSWYDHMTSRGWQMMQKEWYSYAEDNWYVFKRTDVWRGTDDGDVLELLKERGFNRYGTMLKLPGQPFDGSRRPINDIVREILETKWQLSAEAGYDVGTVRAVESWRSSQ